MADHERGAYTPPTADAPLTFDARQPVRGTRPAPVTLILSAIVLIGMIAYFVGVVRAPLTAVVIISEMTANRGMILPLFAAAVVADVAAKAVSGRRLYHGLADNLTAAQTEAAARDGADKEKAPGVVPGA